VEAALAYTGTLLQSAYMQAYAGKVWDEPRGRAARGTGPLQRLYQARNGWLFLGMHPNQLAILDGVAGLGGCASLAGDALADFLASRFAAGAADDWVTALTAAGLGAQRAVSSVPEVMTDPWVVAHGLSVTRQHDTGNQITTVGPGARLSRTPVTPGRPAATPGADARSVLEQAGAADVLTLLCERGTILVGT
jgi:crotonobetainyl-CoA:carnitine CoA-transferase CaiB-like acyl-CoA transferase